MDFLIDLSLLKNLILSFFNGAHNVLCGGWLDDVVANFQGNGNLGVIKIRV